MSDSKEKEQLREKITALETEIEILKQAAAEQETMIMGSYANAEKMLQEALTDKNRFKKNEATLGAVNEFTRLVLETMDEVVMVLSTDGTIQTVNRKLTSLLGYEPAELIGHIADRLFSTESICHCEPLFDQSLIASNSVIYHFFSRNPLQQFEMTLLAKNGQEIIHEFRSSILYSYQGKKIGVVVVGDDIRALKQKNDQLRASLHEVESANNLIMESIHYARTIQRSILANQETIARHLPRSFFIWEPRDVLGGDIYNIFPLDDGNLLLSLFDCTGHGVPGALMTMLSSSKLHHLVRTEKLSDPAEILQQLNRDVRITLHQNSVHSQSDDGLDAGICHLDRQRNTLTFAGARLPLLYIEGQKIIHIKGDRQSLGYRKSDPAYRFSRHQIPLKPRTVFYLHTDGVTDQVGGEKGLPLGNRKFQELLLAHHHLPFDRQRLSFQQALAEFSGGHQKRDDLTFIGFSPHSGA